MDTTGYNHRHQCTGKLRRGPSSFWMHDPEVVFDALALKPGDHFLDLGCGPGEYSIYAATRVGDSGVVHALEKWGYMVEGLKQEAQAQGLNNLKPMTADITEPLPIEDKSIDVCLLSTVLHIFGLSRIERPLFNEIRRVLKPGGRVAGVSLYFTPNAFSDLFRKTPECLKHFGLTVSRVQPEKRLFQQSAFNGGTSVILRQILECPYQGELRRLFLEAKALELVALNLFESENNDKRDGSSLNRQDLERVHEARHTLLERLEDPPSLTALSRLAGINRNKLNQGFKQLYGKTAFNLLRDARLSKARTLLKQTDLSLSEVAFSVGYNSQANFTKAFRAHFGQTPKTVRQPGNPDGQQRMDWYCRGNVRHGG